jgi:2-(1,2-epoxy-1,2-dihydrophenyl)acetyl-CoA isomerase
MQHIRITHDDQEPSIGIITIDRASRFNSLDVETARDLRKAALGLARDPAVRVAVLRGTGSVFCSGADLKYIQAGGRREDLGYLSPSGRELPSGHGEVFKQILEYLHSTISEIRRAPKPFVAAVDGVAAAGGLGLALACDLVVASARSSFEYAYFKTGLCGAESTTFFLPKLIGLRRATDFALLGERLGARRAHELGMVSAVFSEQTFAAETAALCRRLAAGPTSAHAAAKRLMNEAAGADRLDYHLDREIAELARSADSSDFAEGIAAFFEKRTPKFSGR